MTRTAARIDTPLGPMTLVVDGHGRLCSAAFTDGVGSPSRDPAGVASALRDWFAGDLGALDGIEVHTEGTPFQREVWAALRQIPCGETWSYGRLAQHIGRPRAVRAVGAANRANPVAVVVPCHRVVGADGALTGYAGGLHRKQWLLGHERG